MNNENYTFWKDKSYFDVTREKINNSFKICSFINKFLETMWQYYFDSFKYLLMMMNIYGNWTWCSSANFWAVGSKKMRYERKKYPSKQKIILFSYHSHYKISAVLGFLWVTCISNTCSYAYLKRLHDVVASSLEMCVSHFTFPLRWY